MKMSILIKYQKQKILRIIPAGLISNNLKRGSVGRAALGLAGVGCGMPPLGVSGCNSVTAPLEPDLPTKRLLLPPNPTP
jgi:hypothetical protein